MHPLGVEVDVVDAGPFARAVEAGEGGQVIDQRGQGRAVLGVELQTLQNDPPAWGTAYNIQSKDSKE